jgi:uncharacterized protein
MRSLFLNIKILNSWFENCGRITYTIIIVFSLTLITIIFHLLFDIINIQDIYFTKYPDGKESPIIYFVSSVILAPILETFLFQSLPYKFFKKIKNGGNETALLLISASLFGLYHFYSLFYMLYTFLMGLALMYGYLKRVESDKCAFWLIVISHSIFNLGIFIKNVI